MASDPALSTNLDQTIAAARRSLNTAATGDYEQLELGLNRLSDSIRETFQERFRSHYEALSRKLETDAPLTTEEVTDLRLLMTGSAKYYVKYENNYPDWLNELDRLTGELDRLRSADMEDVDTLMHLQALCRDAQGVVPGIGFYLRQQERVARFEEHMQGDIIDSGMRQFLAIMVREMLASESM